LREKGVKIIHCPCDCMRFYGKKSIPMPIETSKNCCLCTPRCKRRIAWKQQHPAIKIAKGELISQSMNEIWNFLKKNNIELVIIMGVHTNMCILGRPFGIMEMVKRGMPIVLVRDLTDAAL